MFKNLILYRIEPLTVDSVAVEEAMGRAAFLACAPTQEVSAGWTPPRNEDGGALLDVVGGQWIARLMTERRALPSEVVKRRTEELADKIEAETGRRPRGKTMRDLKDQARHELLPQAFARRSSVLVWLDPERRTLAIDAASLGKADAVVTFVVECIPGLKVLPLMTALSPVSAMSCWLLDKQAPAGFSIDRECELKQPDGEKAVVRYGRHPVDIGEVGEHIKQGKLPTKLALTFDGRVSFVLTEALALKKLKLLDVVLENSASTDAGDAFDADVAITTGELRNLLPRLAEAMGGELVAGA